MKKLNNCLKQRYWGYCFRKECNQENKLQELMILAYPATVKDINDEIWATNKKN